MSGLTGLRDDLEDETWNDVFLAERRLRVRLKGGNEIWMPLGKKAAIALDCYIRARPPSSQADSPWL